MRKLNKSDKYAIEFLHKQNKTNEEISKELDLSISSIKRIISTLTTSNPVVDETKKDKTKNLMIRQTSAKKNNSVSIMTEGAAQLGDEFVKNLPHNNKKTDSYIYRRPQ